jgi:hypothetical protein
MPATTRSMAKGGLQNDVSSAPPPSTCPACTNANTVAPRLGEFEHSSSSLDLLPVLIHQSNVTPSLSEHDSISDSSLASDFEVSNFETYKICDTSSLLYVSYFETSHNFRMESDYKEEPSVPALCLHLMMRS